MPYSMKDVDAAQALVLSLRPETLISRDDFDWSLSVKDKDSNYAVILFQCSDEARPEISSSPEEIRHICFMLGSRWTPEQIRAINAAGPRPTAINRIR